MKRGQLPALRMDEGEEKECRDAATLEGKVLAQWMRETMVKGARKVIAKSTKRVRGIGFVPSR